MQVIASALKQLGLPEGTRPLVTELVGTMSLEIYVPLGHVNETLFGNRILQM